MGRSPRPDGHKNPRGTRSGVCPARQGRLLRRGLFWGRPTLVIVEPTSLTAVSCRLADDRSAATWGAELAPLSAPQFAVSDGARGIAGAVADMARRRADADADTKTAPLEQGLDLFHIARDARTLVRRAWRQAESAWEAAEAAEATLAKSGRAGIDGRGPGVRAGHARRRAEAMLSHAGVVEAARGRARVGFEVFDDQGRLNNPEAAAVELEAAASELAGREWSKVRNALRDGRSPAFLRRLHRELALAEPDPSRREAMAWRWWGRHHRPMPSSPAVGLACAVAWDRELEGEELASYQAVARVLSRVRRASSAVECLNGVLRMQQARHKRMTQGMLDPKRLYWNSRPLDSGPRKGACPYEHLGLKLPSFDFWELLGSDPARLTQELSTQRDGP